MVVGAALALQLAQLATFKLLLETGVVNSMGELKQIVDVSALAAQTAMEGASS